MAAPTAESSTASPAPAPALGPQSGEDSSGSGDKAPPADGRVDNGGPGNQTDGDSGESGGGPVTTESSAPLTDDDIPF